MDHVVEVARIQQGTSFWDWCQGKLSDDEVPPMVYKKVVWEHKRSGWCAMLFKWVREDDGPFHTHQASWSIRIILRGGYVEELPDGTLKTWYPGMIGFMRSSYAHRMVKLLNGEYSTSLFIRGPTSNPVTVTYEDGESFTFDD